MTRWADFSGPPPGAAALKAAGFGGVIRYVALGSPGKLITAAEYRDYVQAGVRVLLVAELGVNDAWSAADDNARGAEYGRLAVAAARQLGIPDSVGIACAADAHAPDTGAIAQAVQFARGFASVVGQQRSGFYGFRETLTAVHNAGIVGWCWRCGSEPTMAEQQWTHLWQRNDGTQTVRGTVCDINEQYKSIMEGAVTADELLNTLIDDPYPGATPKPVATMLGWAATHAAFARGHAKDALDAVQQLAAQVTALQAAVDQLAGRLGAGQLGSGATASDVADELARRLVD